MRKQGRQNDKSGRDLVIMVKRRLFTVILVMVAALSLTAAAIMMSGSGNDKEKLVVGVGERLDLIFDENPSTGYSWIPVGTCDGTVEIMRDYHQEPEAVPGASAKHVYVIEGREKGRCELHFSYVRTWEDGSSIEEKTIVILVR